jgi:hypothetical protein
MPIRTSIWVFKAKNVQMIMDSIENNKTSTAFEATRKPRRLKSLDISIGRLPLLRSQAVAASRISLSLKMTNPRTSTNPKPRLFDQVSRKMVL